MTHPSEMISAYLDGELTWEEQARLLEHLAGCGQCAGELQEFQAVRSAVRSLPVIEAPAGLMLEEGDVVVPLSRNRGLLLGTAAAVLALVIAVAALVTPPPTQVSVDDLSSRFGARVTLDPAFSPAKVPVPELGEVTE